MNKKLLSIFGGIACAVMLAGTLCACSKGSDDVVQTYSDLDRAQQYRLAEYGISVGLDKDVNVYDANDVNVTACVSDPSGKSYNVPMFWFEEYSRRKSGNREMLDRVGEGQFRMRFTPRASGRHTMYINIVQNGTVKRYPESGTIDFDVKAGTADAFLSVASDHRTLEYDNGRPFVGIGNNFCGWEWAGVDNMGGTYDYDVWFHQLAANGGNMTQFDLSEGDQLEWTAQENELEWSDCYGGLGIYNQKIGFKTDYKVNLADGLGLFYRFTLFHWEDFDTESDSFPDWGWSRNPYNTRNGGPVENVRDFFRNEEAKTAVKNYLRYVVARWGYSPSLMMYELFNEVDAPDMVWGAGNSYMSSLNDIRVWHDEMSKYLKEIDPNKHLVTTSCADASNGREFWNLEAIDVTTFHRYTMYNGGNAIYETVKSLATLVKDRIASTQKPVVAGEFALSPGGDLQREGDKEGVVFHNALYASVFAGSFGTAMSWTWGSYVDEYDLYPHYKAVNRLFGGADLRGATPFDNLSETVSAGTVSYMGLRNGNRAYLWIKDGMYDYNHLQNGYNPTVMPAGSVTVSGMPAGEYAVELIDPLTGEIVSVERAVCADGKLAVGYPAFERDLAAKIIHTDAYYESYDMYAGSDTFIPRSSYTLQNSDSITLYANGYDIGGASDSGRFAYLKVKGDFVYTARIDRTNYACNGAKAGLMVRDTLTSASKSAFVGCTNNGNYLALFRSAVGLPAAYHNYGYGELGAYLRVERQGNRIVCYVSADGTSFEKAGEQEYASLPEELFVGVMAANKNTLGYNKAVFSDIRLVRK